MRERRAQEIDQALAAHFAAGGGALFGSQTLRHHRGDALADRLDVVAQAVRLCFQGAPWDRRKSALDVLGFIRALEVTWGLNGWHPHAHWLLLTERPLTAAEVADLRRWLFGRWSTVVERHGFGSINSHGLDLRPVRSGSDLGGYLTKVDGGWSAGREIARGDAKRKGSTPIDLLRSFAQTGDVGALSLWREYERATAGKRAIRWSPGLKARLEVAEVDDVTAAASEGADLTLLRALVPSQDWRAVVRAGTTADLLQEVEEVATALLLLADLCGVDVRPLDVREGVERAS